MRHTPRPPSSPRPTPARVSTRLESVRVGRLVHMEARMPRVLLVLTLTLTFVLPAVVRAQDPNLKQLAARVELHAIPSLTLSDAQFLTGDTSGKPVSVN